MVKNINELFKKYISGNINSAERQDLRQAVNSMSDPELSNILSGLWSQYNDDVKSPDLGGFDQVLRHIRFDTPRHKYRAIKITARVAAAVIIPLLIVFQIHYIIDNRKLKDFIARDFTVDVRSGQMADIILPDGSKIFLNAATTVKYNGQFGLENRKIDLRGEAYMQIAKDSTKPFIVNTEKLKIEVLGTEFNVSSYDCADVVETTLIKGSVKVAVKGNSMQTAILSPGEKAIYYNDTGTISVVSATGFFETAWMRGELIFRSAKFTDIMRKLELRYGVSIEIVGNKYNTDLFTGSIKEDYVNGVLRLLQMHYDFTYTTQADKIYVRFNQ